MPRRSLSTALLLALLCASPAFAQEANTASAAESLVDEVAVEPIAPLLEELEAERQRLQEENQRLEAALSTLQADVMAERWPLNEGQRWFVLGATVSAISFILGVLFTRGQRRRQWLN